MTFQQKVREKYFEWLYNYVCKGRSHDKVSYIKVFTYLHEVEFIYNIPNDVNRAEDGIALRYRFAIEEGNEDIISFLDSPCSVLEMMVALAIRCEETIMDDTRYGDRTGQWFWSMMASLGISNMVDDVFDINDVSYKIERFLLGDYAPDGKGGLFHIRNCEYDIRSLEIWTQLCWYLDNFT